MGSYEYCQSGDRTRGVSCAPSIWGAEIKITEKDLLDYEQFLVDMKTDGCPLPPAKDVQRRKYDDKRILEYQDRANTMSDKHFERARREWLRLRKIYLKFKEELV